MPLSQNRVRVINVECECGWKFATVTFPFAEAIHGNHQCANFVIDGKDDKAFDILDNEGDLT